MSNGPATRAGGHPPQWRHVSDLDPQAPQQPHPHQQQWPTPPSDYQHYGYSNQPAQPAPQQHNGHAPQYPAYHYPDNNAQQGTNHAPQGYGQPAGQYPQYYGQQPTPPAPAPAPFTPSFEQYVNGHSHGPDMYRNHEPARAPEPPSASLRDQLRGTHGYDQWQTQQSPRNYDLGSYMPAGSQHQPDYGQAMPGHGFSGDTRWRDHEGHDPLGYEDSGLSLPVAAEHHDHDDTDYDYDEPPRRRRGLLIVSSLVGAIVVGGGLAYAYKTILGPSNKTPPPVIKADSRPSKVQPTDPGGKQFANADSKLMGRLESENGGSVSPQPPTQPTASPTADDPTGVRRVSTVTIGRDGAIAAPGAEPRLPPPTVTVPGMNVDFGTRPGPGFGTAPSRPPEGPRSIPVPQVGSAGAPVPQPQAPTQVIARASPPIPQPDIPVAQTTPAQPQRPSRQLLPPPKRTAAIEAPSAVAAPKPTTSGFVAVLSSQKSRMDALKTFADLQQKYPTVLQNKFPDVQEADLSARGLGTMYRVVVGPPGSREAANDVCGQLKSAGFTGCWVTAY